MKLSDVMQVELFHLLFLRQYSQNTAPNLYAIKGGCNLRFFFDSVRYSEDLDIDVSTIQKKTLENKVNKILSSILFQKLMREYDISGIKFSTPKQTDTTQRWKIQLQRQNKLSLNTKIEFSRRNKSYKALFENISLRLCQHYHLPPLRLAHYSSQDAVLQKIHALANRLQTQARDVFDLYHLLHIDHHPLLTATKEIKEKAMHAIASLDFHDFQSQVVSFLEKEKQQEFDHRHYWNEMTETVSNFIGQQK